MCTFPVLTALSLPAVTTLPSAQSLQWSDDGQAVLLTSRAVFVLCPDPGINVERSSIVKQPLNETKMKIGSHKPVGWLRTMIEWGKVSEVFPWAAECGEWGCVALGSLDLSLVGVTCSPSNITANGGAMIAILDSNAEVSVYAANKNHLTGKWMKMTGLLNALRKTAEAKNLETSFEKVLHMQATCVSWSRQTDFGMTPASSIDGSILAVGNRAGHVCLLRYIAEAESDPMECVASIEVADCWVSHLAWSDWKSSQRGLSSVYLACGIVDGSVVIFRLSQTLESSGVTSGYPPVHTISISHQIVDSRSCEADHRKLTSLQWVQTPHHEPVLAFTKPGTLHLWSAPSSTAPWSGLQTKYLKTQKSSVGSSALSPISGITYARSQEALVISLADGSFHAVNNLLTNPILTSDIPSNGFSSAGISQAARTAFVRTEEGSMKKLDVNAIHGMSSYDKDSFYLWIHEDFRPTDFSYKHDAKHTTVFVMGQLWNGSSDEYIINLLEDEILHCAAYKGEAPISVLRPIFLHLQNAETLARLHPRVLSVLQRNDHPDNSVTISLPPWTEGLTPELRRQFGDSLRMHLFGWNSLLTQRLQISLAAFCAKQCEDPARQEDFLRVLGQTMASLRSRLLRIIIRHIAAVVDVLNPEDVPSVLRIVVQALLPDIPLDVSAEAQDLSSRVQPAVSADSNATSSALGLDELCPACHAHVPLNDIATATCPNGHVWARCSITSFILSTPMVRTCIGCSRKAFLAPRKDTAKRNWLPHAARSWLVEELLHAVRRCFFCGNSFVTLV